MAKSEEIYIGKRIKKSRKVPGSIEDVHSKGSKGPPEELTVAKRNKPGK